MQNDKPFQKDKERACYNKKHTSLLYFRSVHTHNISTLLKHGVNQLVQYFFVNIFPSLYQLCLQLFNTTELPRICVETSSQKRHNVFNKIEIRTFCGPC